MQPQAIVLCYFDIAGRAQPLRYALSDAEVIFEDLRVSSERFQAERESASYAGPYQGLPTLQWDDATIAETLPISSFIARKLGQYDGLSDVEVAAQQALCSNCYIEVLVRIGEVIWGDLLYPGADHALASSMLMSRAIQKLTAVDRQLSGEWLSGAQPGVSDFFALESVQVLRYVLGAQCDPRLARRFPRLFDLAQRLAVRPNVARAQSKRPTAFTAHPDEAAVIARMRALDPARFGL